MNDQKLSVFAKIGFAISTFYLIYSACFFVIAIDRDYIAESERQIRVANSYLKLGRTLLQAGFANDLSARLSDALEVGDIDYFAVKIGDVDLAYENRAGIDDPILFEVNPKEGRYETDNYRHFVIREGEYELLIGHKTSRWVAVQVLWKRNKDLFIKDIFLVILAALSIVLYNFRDYRKILGQIKKRGLRRGDTKMARSSETLTLVQGLKGYESNIDSLSLENAMLKGAVLPALKKEIFSGRQPPYEFWCTVVRADINNFTTIFSSAERPRFMETINEFFIDVTHVVSRYGGFVYEFIGDEVIVYFKDEDFPNADSSSIAISAIRDIQALAERVNEKTEAERGYSFRIKSSLSYGVLRFGPLVDGFSLAGAPLIETVRLLSTVDDKSENIALMDSVVRDRIGDLCLTRDHKVVMLKGLPGARRTFIYKAHVPLHHHLKQKGMASIAYATYYRDDASLCEIIDYVRTERNNRPREEILVLLGSLKNFRATRTGAEVKAAYLELLEELLQNASWQGSFKPAPVEPVRWQSSETATVVQTRSSLRLVSAEPNQVELTEAFILASTISAASQVFDSGSFKGRLKERIVDCLKIENKRIVANTLDVLADLDPTAGEDLFGDVFSKYLADDNRIAGNVLVKQGKKDWNKKASRKLKEMLRGKNPYFKASGLYALGEISAYLRLIDPVAFQADSDLQSHLSEMLELTFHANKMVRRQALRAIEKSARVEEFRSFVLTRKISDDIMAEFASVLSGSGESTQSESGKSVAG